jgi:subtilisin family serine protease
MWENGHIWTKRPGPKYDVNSDIGPLDDGRGERSRNPAAVMRWNWGLDRIDSNTPVLDDVYRYGNVTGEGTTLYNLDTGVMISHDDFGGRAVPGYSVGCPTGHERACLSEWAYRGIIDAEVMTRPDGCANHGTHTASAAAGSKYGVASGAEIIPVQVLNCSGSSGDMDVIDGINWAVEHAVNRQPRRPSVLALSLGRHERSWMLNHAVVTAVNFGLLVVVAAANEGGTQLDDSCGGSPASSSSAITVGATGLNEDLIVNGKLSDEAAPHDVLAPFSSIGTCVDIFAPGVEARSSPLDSTQTQTRPRRDLA